MKNYVSNFKEEASIEKDGGKGYNLKLLTQGGFNVPPGVVISAEFYSDLFENPGTFTYNDTVVLEQECLMMQNKIKEKSLLASLIKELSMHLDSNDLFAVRSSSTFEDLADSAFAGQHETYLNVSWKDLSENILECYASLWNMHAVKYRHERGFSQKDASMAIVIQKMVPSEVAGVAFSVDPISGKFDTVLIESSPGLGENVVSGENLTDTYSFNLTNGTVKETLCGETSSLTELQVLAVAQLAKQIEKHYKSPQDIEWAFYNGHIYLLQSRPQTTVPAYYTLDESAERFPKAVSNLTWEFVEEAFNESLEYSLKLMSINLPTRPWFKRIDGFVYGNQNAVRMLAMKRPILEKLSDLNEKYFWAKELVSDWKDNLSLYLTRIGKLQNIPSAGESYEEFRNYFSQMFKTANDYFKPNIAISMTQGFLVASLMEQLISVYEDQVIAREKLQKLLLMADIKTAKINHNLSKIKNRDLKSEEFQLFLEKYGHRELEFDYYFPTWAEKPEVLMESNVTNKNHMTQKESYEIGLKTLQEVLSHVSAENFAYMYELIQLTVQFTELDDEEHFQTTRVNLLARRAAKSLGEKLKLNDPYDVFFLTKEELLMLDESFEENNELIEKLQNRRNDYQHLLETNPTWDISGEEEEEIVDPSALKGVPGSAGSVEGNIFIVKSVDEFKNVPDGAILVTRTTNPAWTTLFYNAKALITESGGPLSHGAVTAREVGIPAVMSVKNAMSILKTGDKVIVDGTHGLVKKIS